MSTRPLALLLLLFLFLASGCATTALPACPRDGGPRWRLIESEHFEVYTDAASARAADLAADLEFTRAALAQLLAPGWVGPLGRIPVLLLSGKGHFANFFPVGIEGAFTEVLMQPIVYMSGTSSLSRQTLIKHELTHFLVDDYVRFEAMPMWVVEGLAAYFETLEVDRQSGRVTVGKSVDDRVIPALATFAPQRLGRELADWQLAMLRGDIYGPSWVKVSYLINVRPTEFATYLKRLHEGMPHEAAWATAFPTLSEAGLDQQMPAFIAHGKSQVTTVRFTFPPTTSVERAVDDATVHGWRAILYAQRNRTFKKQQDADSPERARAEIAEAQRQDPGSVLALGALLLLDRERDITVELARLATTAHPDAWFAWYALALAQKQGGDEAASWGSMKEALRRAALNPSVRLQEKLQNRTRRRGERE